MSIEIIITIVAAFTGILAGLAGYLTQRVAKRMREKESQLREIYSKRVDDLWNEYYEEFEADLKDERGVEYYNKTLKYLLSEYKKSWRDLLVHYPAYNLASLPKAEIETEANKKLDELKKRIEEMEKRFPKEATLEKIASVNDAILATKIEALSDTVNRIEKKLLTKWDVAIVVFEILGALGILVGIVFVAVNYIAGS